MKAYDDTLASKLGKLRLSFGPDRGEGDSCSAHNTNKQKNKIKEGRQQARKEQGRKEEGRKEGVSFKPLLFS